MDEKLRKYSDFLLNEYMKIDYMFESYFYLYNQQKDGNILYVMNKTPMFWGFTMDAFLNESILLLSKLFDEDKNTISILKFLNYIDQNKNNIWSDNDELEDKKREIENDKNKLKNLEAQIQKVKGIRDQYLAHNDKQYAAKEIDVWVDKDLIIKDIRQLIRLINEIVQNYFYDTPFISHPVEDIEFILNQLSAQSSGEYIELNPHN